MAVRHPQWGKDFALAELIKRLPGDPFHEEPEDDEIDIAISISFPRFSPQGFYAGRFQGRRFSRPITANGKVSGRKVGRLQFVGGNRDLPSVRSECQGGQAVLVEEVCPVSLL
jgi:hypothetical protein